MSGERLYRSVLLLVLYLSLCLHGRLAAAEMDRSIDEGKHDEAKQLFAETDAIGPQRFLAVHGRRSLIQGYATHGLEVWGYPLQIVNGYQVGFRSQGSTTEIDGAALLRKISYEAEAVTRTYIGSDFIVRERLFVPLNQAAAILTYTIDSQHAVDIVVHFTPVLDLMWPASIGGQSTSWNTAAYVLSEPSRRFSAFVGSSDTISHDEPVNSAQPGSGEKRFAFTMRAGGSSGPRSATVVVSLLDPSASEPANVMQKLLTAREDLEREAHAHYAALESNSLEIITPDENVNRALAWAGIALDQSWVCNPYLGCGLVAGYGPSRDARRPQYEWFFAGDGLIAIDGLLSSGQYDRAREALLFIDKYQDRKTGMIWHELSQSASFLDWVNQYPYMFVHVDITFQYLSTVARYLSTSGDKQFVIDHWSSLQSAYDYCKSLSKSADSLPRIPSSKEGSNEQDRLTDELGLSLSWVEASESFAQLAEVAGHAAEAAEARQVSERARKSIAGRYWMKDSSRWIDGYTVSGKPVVGGGIGGIHLIDHHILQQAQSDVVLSRIASSDFQTDWGTRSIASSSPRFNANSYASGSVWATGTTSTASAFWTEHQPYTAFPIWRSLIQWNSLDSLGHLHEVLAGDFYHQQTESVPEQTWSSAAFLSSSVHGLLGLEVDALTNHVTFSPHLPAQWDSLRVNRVRLSHGSMDLSVVSTREGLELTVENEGAPLALRFAPEIPLGARLEGALLNGKQVRATLESHDQDSHAVMDLQIPHGKTHCSIRYQGGVSIGVSQRALLAGEPSRGIKITDVRYKGDRLVIQADATGFEATIFLRTTEKIVRVTGAELHPLSNGSAELAIVPAADSAASPSTYRHVEVVVNFSPSKGKSTRAKTELTQ
ncbi:MAG TPA: hypothetical protein VM554_14025 [Acidisarcina sp.]|nr:hypothetical protein [Acidisarcina sp.]